ncbi:MAG: hypothetical protein LBL36_00080 [Clostridiales Family XIII bacterium]|jgi:hypothetical protein|nr:hypothetical protein [Clostridiales Family XIII bacterium]
MLPAEEFAKAVKKLYEDESKLSKAEQKKRSMERLILSGLFNEDGEFTDHYSYSRDYYNRKAKARA